MSHTPGSYVFSREQVRRVDGEATNRYGIPGMVLMENASRGLALHALTMLGWPDAIGDARVAILCGGGNNGGDGLAAARHLHNHGVEPVILLTTPANKYSGDAACNLNICQEMRLKMIDASKDPADAIRNLPAPALWLDGLFGTGLRRAVRPPFDAAVNALNDQAAPVLAIDIPSGLDCDTGCPLGCAVRARATVTFVGPKRGFANPDAKAYLGQVIVTDIGVPSELVEQLGDPVASEPTH